MIFEHEIPEGSKLYFGESAKRKREVEYKASQILQDGGFEEIVTPYFTYHAHLSSKHKAAETRKVIRLGDDENNLFALRPDSSLDVVRIITKRLGRSTDHKKWFYIQPVFAYPSLETHQIGVEHIDCEDTATLPILASQIFDSLGIRPILQLSSSKIPQLVAKEMGFAQESVGDGFASQLLATNIDWVCALLAVCDTRSAIEILPMLPKAIAVELEILRAIADRIGYENTVLAPLYTSKTAYYTDFFFRFFEGNDLLAKGGNYVSHEKRSSGFAIYTDTIVQRYQK